MSYLSAYVPNDGKHSYNIKTSWRGLNKKNTIDSGELSNVKNIKMTELPYLKTQPLQDAESTLEDPALTFSYIGANSSGQDQYATAYFSSYKFQVDIYTVGSSSPTHYEMVYVPPVELLPFKNENIRIVPFNRYVTNEAEVQNIVSARFKRYVLFYPVNISLNVDDIAPALGQFSFYPVTGATAPNYSPILENIAVHQGRVWGTRQGKLYASKWNAYENWQLPNATDIEEGKDISSWAWVSETQSDITAAEDFTAIVSYDSHIVAFKKHFMHQVYNTKNPFRIVDIGNVGCVSQNAVCVCNRILFFAAEDGVYSYTGAYPERISEKINVTSCSNDCLLGCDDRVVYFWDGTTMYTYDTENGCWSSVDVTGTPLRLVHIGHHCFALCGHNVVAFDRGSTYGTFNIETDLIWRGTINENRILKIRLYVTKINKNALDWLKLYVSSSVKEDGWTQKATYMTSETGDAVISVTPRLLSDFGHRFKIEGTGDWYIRYFYEEFLDSDRQNKTTGITTL